MGKKLTYLAVFALGIATGVGASWKIINDRYNTLIDEELKSLREVFNKKEEVVTEEESIDEPDEDCSTPASKLINNYKSLAKKYSEEKASEKEEDMVVDKPYVIAPFDFGEFDDYETITLSYYADKVLADESDNIIEDVDSMIGYESLRHIGDYEEDVVHVRNDSTKCDYEICRDVRKYSDVVGM